MDSPYATLETLMKRIIRFNEETHIICAHNNDASDFEVLAYGMGLGSQTAGVLPRSCGRLLLPLWFISETRNGRRKHMKPAYDRHTTDYGALMGGYHDRNFHRQTPEIYKALVP